ncbi:hypothetical protein AB0I81_56780 [Nonomuraea sp. NPDC050404]|uniref:hypothetical protein n=1 Tax=Nonomuraea sp. NPDC050404 TaxID=3155783 RepID=UPI0033E2A0E3
MGEYDANVLVILAIAAIAILACVVLVSLGRGGELTEFPPDVPPLDLPEAGQLTAVDFMALQLPVNLVGYHTQSVDETLRRAATAISARDTRIAVLEQRVSELLSSRLHARQEIYAAPGAGPRTEHEPEAPAVPRELPESGDPVSASGATVAWDGGAQLRHLPEEPEWRVPEPDGQAEAPESEPAAEAKPEDEPAAEAKSNEQPAADVKADEEPATEAKADEEPVADVKVDEEPVAEAKVDEELEAKPGEGAPDGEEPVRAAVAKDGDERS